FDARGRDRAGRIESAPPASDQRFGPCVSIRLADDEIAARWIDLTPLVAGDHARGDACGAQQDDETARVVLAKAAALIEQERIDRVRTRKQGRRERVEERFGA